MGTDFIAPPPNFAAPQDFAAPPAGRFNSEERLKLVVLLVVFLGVLWFIFGDDNSWMFDLQEQVVESLGDAASRLVVLPLVLLGYMYLNNTSAPAPAQHPGIIQVNPQAPAQHPGIILNNQYA